MAQILTPGFLKWDGFKYILDPNVDGSTGPTIVNSGVGILPDIISDEAGVPAAVIAFVGASNMTLTGIKDGVESRELKIFNTNIASTLTIKHLDVTSSTGNQIVCPGGVDLVTNYQEGILLVYNIVDSKWKVVERSIPVSITVGGTNKQIQFNDGGNLGGLARWTKELNGELHVNHPIMNDWPAVDFAGTTITRLYGSWITDGFAIGDIIDIRGTVSNNITTTITNMSATVLTVNTPLVTESVSSFDVAIEGGGMLTSGPGNGIYPNTGVWKVATPAQYTSETTLIAARDSTGVSIPLLSVNSYTDLQLGGTYFDSNHAAGVTTQRPDSIAMWGFSNINFCDEIHWRGDQGTFTNFEQRFRARVETTSATPTLLISKTTSTFEPFIEIYVVARSTFPSVNYAAWRFFGSKADSGFDWRTATYYKATAGASAWTAVVTSDATVTVTGAASTNIIWKTIVRFI